MVHYLLVIWRALAGAAETFIQKNRLTQCIETTLKKLHLSYGFGAVVPLYLSRGQLSATDTAV